MTSAIGLVLVIGAVALLWFFLPRKGQRHRWLDFPMMESLVPLAFVSAIAIGATMLFSGF
jgi:hypothetical protein